MAETAPSPVETENVRTENRFEDLADRIMEREEKAAADAAPAEAPPVEAQPAETPAKGEAESPDGGAPARDENGRFTAQQPATDDLLVTIKGPWGEEKLDPRKPEDRARLVEYGQKGRNYQELIAKDDQRVTKRAQEVAFDTYRSMGLVGVNPDGTTFWTPKGLRMLQEHDAAGASAPAAPKVEPDAISDAEVDSLVDRVIATEDPAEAKKALQKAITAAARKYGEEAARTVTEKFWQEKAKDIEAKEQERRQATGAAELRTRIIARRDEEIAKHPVIASNPRFAAAARELVRSRTAALESQGVPGPDAFEQGLLEVSLYARDIEGLKSQGVKEVASAASAQRRAPPATGGGSAAPPPAAKPKFNPADPFGDDFNERVLNKVRAAAPR